MDIDLLSQMVKELILDNDKVALPGLGSFVAELVPATYSDKGYTINPPYRRLFFRPLTEDDGLLSGLYSEANHVDRSVAEHIIGDFLSEMRTVLQEKKIVVFPGLGRLRATRENNFFFVADEDLDIWPEGSGLEPVSLKTHTETEEEFSAAVEELKSIIDTPSEVAAPIEELEAAPIEESEEATPIEDSAEPESETEPAEPEPEPVVDELAPEPEPTETEPAATEPVADELAPEPEPAPVKPAPKPYVPRYALPEKKPVDKNKIITWISLSIIALVVLLVLVFVALTLLNPSILDPLR